MNAPELWAEVADTRARITRLLAEHPAGNTWIASAQAASATGTYAVPGGQNKLDVTGAQTGANYVIKGSAAASTTLRLAENACIPQATCN